MKKKLSPAGVKYSRPPISAKASRKYDAMMKFDFALLDDRPGVIRDWAKSRWGHDTGPLVRVWEVGAVCGGSEHWIPRIMDIWARDV